MFPAACYKRIFKKESNERTLSQLILAGGFLLMILGTYANLNAIDVKRSGAHLASDFQKAPELKPQTPVVRLTEEPFISKPKNISKVLLPPKNTEEPKRSPVSPQPEPDVPKKDIPKAVPTTAEEEQHKKLDEQKDIELKKTKDELELTKQLLERKTGQLREAQDLVVGKLGEVVEKVEEIAKEIKEDKEEEVKVVKEVPKVEDILLKVQQIKKTIDLEKSSNDTIAIPKDSLIDRLTKNGSKNIPEKVVDKEEVNKLQEKKNQGDVKLEEKEKAEKIAEAVDEVKVKPVPLAVLINSSKVEIPNAKNEPPQPQPIVKNETLVKEEENANIEAIRRDLLEEKPSDDPPSKVKRSPPPQEDCPKKSSPEHTDET